MKEQEHNQEQVAQSFLAENKIACLVTAQKEEERDEDGLQEISR